MANTPSTPLLTQVVAATVFADRARITRRGRAQLAAGEHRLDVSDLPLNLAPDSVRASGKGTARAQLAGVSTHLEQFSETPAEAARALEHRVRDAEDQDADLAARDAVLEAEQRHLDTLAAQSEMFARGLALRNRTAEEQGAIFDFIRARRQTLAADRLAIARDRREGALLLDRLRRELKALQGARPKQRYIATVEVVVSEPGDLELDLVYLVTGAGWKPLYDIRLVEANLSLAYLAEVRQVTGEDWTGVELTLSTARPSATLAIPELDPWYLRPRPIPPPAPAKMAARAAGALAPQVMPVPAQVAPASADEAPSVVVAAMLEREAAVSESGAALTYRLPAPADVPGNNDPRKVHVAGVGLEPVLTYVAAPKLEPVCYRRLEVKNTSAFSFLPGRAQLFEQDDYLGTTDLEFIAPGQSFEMALGADERLRVERKLAARDVDKAFILGDRRRIRYAYTIEVENLRDGPQTVLVRDQLPVARDEQIKVRLDGADPKPDAHTELNQLEWKLTLDKGAKRIVRFDFSVEFPRSLDVLGLA